VSLKSRIVILGDRGIPARYGGYSTLVEEVSTRLVRDHDMDVTVYCRRHYYTEHPPEYRGVHLRYAPAPGGKSLESIVNTNLTVWHAALDGPFDLAFVVDPGNAPFLFPLIARGIPRIVHTDGLGWQRTKWNRVQRSYYRWAERACARLATWLVTDSRVMGHYYLERFGAPSTFIPYGHSTGDPARADAPAAFGLERGRYLLAVARMEPENNLDLIIEEYKRSRCPMPLLVVGGSRYESRYARETMALCDDVRVRAAGNVFDSAQLNGLYAHCYLYLHGHEVGGTNPSLLRSMGAGAACLPIDVPFHREVLGPGQSEFFEKRPGDLARWIDELTADPARVAAMARHARERAESEYRWDAVAAAYAELFRAVIAAARDGAPFRPRAFESYRPSRLVGEPLAPS